MTKLSPHHVSWWSISRAALLINKRQSRCRWTDCCVISVLQLRQMYSGVSVSGLARVLASTYPALWPKAAGLSDKPPAWFPPATNLAATYTNLSFNLCNLTARIGFTRLFHQNGPMPIDSECKVYRVKAVPIIGGPHFLAMILKVTEWHGFEYV